MQDQARTEVKFSEWIQGGFDLYKENFVLLMSCGLIVYLISGATAFILFGPLSAGLIRIILRLHDKQEPKPEMGEVFKGFDVFLHSFLFVLVWFLVPGILSLLLYSSGCGAVLAVPLSLAATGFSVFGLFYIAEEGMEFWPASQKSIAMVKTNFWPFLGLAVLASIMGAVGSVACGIGAGVTLPLNFCILAVAYRDIYSDTELVSSDAEPESGAVIDLSAAEEAKGEEDEPGKKADDPAS